MSILYRQNLTIYNLSKKPYTHQWGITATKMNTDIIKKKLIFPKSPTVVFSWAFLHFSQMFFKNPLLSSAVFNLCSLKVYERGNHHPLSRLRKEVNTMNEPARTQWQIRCAFYGFCKETLRNEAVNAHNHVKWRQSRETIFSDLSPQEENQLYTYDRYFADDKAEQSFCVAGKEISAKLLAEAMHSLPEEKRKCDFRILCEHSRAITFILGDPKRITPSNTEQGTF